MNAKDMHYDYLSKLNIIDSQKYKGLKVPEIDWSLNEAQELFVKIIAEPRIGREVGFETNQRTIDDIKSVVINQTKAQGIVPTLYDDSDKSYLATLPTDYMFYVGGIGYADKKTCIDKRMNLHPIQHDDENEVAYFDKSSFEWRIINIRFMKDGIRMFTDGTFTPKKFCMNYIKKLRVIHNAEDYTGGTYKDLEGNNLTGVSNCELPFQVHREIVDLAVYITAGNLNLPSYMVKQNKVKLNSA